MGISNELPAESGVSWLHDELRKSLTERIEFLKNAIARGVPDEEYRQFVGRFREASRLKDEIDELFVNFYQDDIDEEVDLGELEGETSTEGEEEEA